MRTLAAISHPREDVGAMRLIRDMLRHTRPDVAPVEVVGMRPVGAASPVAFGGFVPDEAKERAVALWVAGERIAATAIPTARAMARALPLAEHLRGVIRIGHYLHPAAVALVLPAVAVAAPLPAWLTSAMSETHPVEDDRRAGDARSDKGAHPAPARWVKDKESRPHVLVLIQAPRQDHGDVVVGILGGDGEEG